MQYETKIKDMIETTVWKAITRLTHFKIRQKIWSMALESNEQVEYVKSNIRENIVDTFYEK